MFTNQFNWRNLFIFLAIIIVLLSLFYSNQLSKKIAQEETKRIELWVEGLKESADPNINPTNLSTKVLTESNKDIPMIFANEKDSIIDTDSSLMHLSVEQKLQKLNKFRNSNPGIQWTNPIDTTKKNIVYYGESKLLQQIRYFPIIQLILVGIFIFTLIYIINTRNKSIQNQVWAGLAKEAAHQLGTPISSLEGWLANLTDSNTDPKIVSEMEKDVERLRLVSDRFGKIGSIPQLEETNILKTIEEVMDYVKQRAPQKVHFSIYSNGENEILAAVNPPLFDWVIENLLKNALDAMEGKGEISINIENQITDVIIDVKDSGKGISRQNIAKVFNPGFTTKKRGWGLGLSLSKRIIEQYHKGQLLVKNSELGKGTTFRIILNK